MKTKRIHLHKYLSSFSVVEISSILDIYNLRYEKRHEYVGEMSIMHLSESGSTFFCFSCTNVIQTNSYTIHHQELTKLLMMGHYCVLETFIVIVIVTQNCAISVTMTPL